MTQEYAILYLEINMVSLVLIAIILVKTRGLSKMVAQRNFVMSIIAEMVFIISDTVYVMINEGALHFGTAEGILKHLCKGTYFFSTSMMCYFWFIYFEYFRGTAFVREKKIVRAASSVFLAMAVLLIINIFTDILFYVDKEGVYHRGPLFILTYILPYTYVLVECIRTIRAYLDKDHTENRSTLLMLIIFPLAPGCAGIIQFFFPRMPVACGLIALATLGLYLNWTDQLISLDPLTGLNNRKHISHYYEQWKRNRSGDDVLNLLMIDANRFKSINDTYGHIEGDNALKSIAEALRSGCRGVVKRADIARYGGDEFTVMFESENSESSELLKKSITEELSRIHALSGAPFELTVSIGEATSDGSLTLKEFIDAADDMMYMEKKALR